MANIQKGWLPQLSASMQATYQSDVTVFPDEINSIYRQMGISINGLKKDQYRIGADVQQTIYDGGNIHHQKEIARKQGQVLSAQNDIDIYNIGKRVNEMYFSLLLTDEQIKLNTDLQNLLDENEKKLSSMLKNGTAAESDWQNV
ncbi:MAG: TolC family protein, partial [Bacteroidaceae bacterium]